MASLHKFKADKIIYTILYHANMSGEISEVVIPWPYPSNCMKTIDILMNWLVRHICRASQSSTIIIVTCITYYLVNINFSWAEPNPGRSRRVGNHCHVSQYSGFVSLQKICSPIRLQRSSVCYCWRRCGIHTLRTLTQHNIIGFVYRA